jgi:hypothetical protein
VHRRVVRRLACAEDAADESSERAGHCADRGADARSEHGPDGCTGSSAAEGTAERTLAGAAVAGGADTVPDAEPAERGRTRRNAVRRPPPPNPNPFSA